MDEFIMDEFLDGTNIAEDIKENIEERKEMTQAIKGLNKKILISKILFFCSSGLAMLSGIGFAITDNIFYKALFFMSASIILVSIVYCWWLKKNEE